MESYWFAYGYKTRANAELVLETAYSAGDVSPGENPRIEAYQNKNGEKRYGIRVN
jgi:hypothetical protein